MDKFKVNKVDNCFKDNQTYEYKLNLQINEEFLKKLQLLGKLEVKNFRRPIFIIYCENQNKIKGIINSNTIKVSYPNNMWECNKKEFEIYLEKILK